MARLTPARSPALAGVFLLPVALVALARAIVPTGWYAGRAVAALNVLWLALAAAWLVAGRLRRTRREPSPAATPPAPPPIGVRDAEAFPGDLADALAGPPYAAGVVLVAIDQFAAYAATWSSEGPAAVEALQREVGELLVATVRAGDTAYRHGAGRFAVLLRGGNVSAAAALAERLRLLIARTFLRQGITASFGVAAAPETAGTVADLTEAAESALYDAARFGRNRVAVAAALSEELQQVRANAVGN